VRIIGAGQDITERKRAEEALRESEERYRNIFENANDMIATFTLDGIITNVNRGLEVALGWSREELIGQHYSKLATPAALALADERTQRALAGEEMLSIFEAEIVRKDGRVVPIEVRSRFIRDAVGQPTGVQGIFRDLTERKRAEERLHLLSRQLLEMQESERRHLARELHDEIGQELTTLKLMLQMTKGSPEAVAQRRHDSLKLVDDLLVKVRTLSLDLRPLMLDELGLVATLDWYVKRQGQRAGFVVHFATDTLEPRPH
jgi:PAS domain S-box-containing protein